MEKNLILAVTLSMLIYLGWYTVVEKYYVPTKPPAIQASQPQTPQEEAALLDTSRENPALALEAGPLQLKLQPLGASIASFLYPGPMGKVDLIYTPSPGFLATWPKLAFQLVQDKSSVACEAIHPSGVRIRKEFLFQGSQGLHTLRIHLTNPLAKMVLIDDLELTLGPGLGTVPSEKKENSQQWSALLFYSPQAGKKQGRLETIKPNGKTQRHEGPWQWVGIQNRYFLAALVTPAEHFLSLQTGTAKQDKELRPWIQAKAQTIQLAPNSSLSLDIPFYLGPKGYTHLETFGLQLERSVNFGWFNQLGRFTLKVLHFLHDLTGNWGWAIILLTVLLQFIVFPLTYKSMKAAAAMKKIQPEITKIQQKFSKDPKRMNAELMDVYKKSGANPLGGCLPILVQMPIFIALFNALRNAWELHGAPWALWVRDLSAQDPYYILPLIMGGVMFVQNKMNPPAVADPVQAKIFTYMPLLFTFMFLNFPAGLVLYWLTNSLLSLAQQMLLKKRLS